MTHFFRDQGRSLLANGYRIIPIEPGTKRPVKSLTDWGNILMGPSDLSRFPDSGVGVLTGVGVNPIVAIDIDTETEELSAKFTQWCLSNLGRTAPVRTGRAPKNLLVYRASEAGWQKGSSARFFDLFDQKNQLEILGRGQQFVAYAMHPDTGKPYTWGDEVGGLESIRVDELPLVTLDQLVLVVKTFEEMATAMLLDRQAAGAPFVPKEPKERTPRSDEDFFGRVNDAAMSALDAWVPDLFPNARAYHGGFRVAQADLGRNHLEEDLSILPTGIKDFGVADQGDAKQGGRTPIDLVLEWSHLTMDDMAVMGVYEAAMWLCDQMETPREELGYGLKRRRENEAGKDAMRSALAGLKQRLDESEDMVAVRTDVLPQVRVLLTEFPLLESEAYNIVQAKAKSLSSSITKGEFHKLVSVSSVPTVRQVRPLTEFGNTERMLDRYGKSLMYCPDIGAWYIWNGNNWRKALGGRSEIEHFAKETVRALANEVDNHPEPGEFYQFCALSQRAFMVHNMVALAESDPRVAVPASELDKYPYFLGVKNGVVDLRNGMLLPADPELRITLTCACEYDPTAKAPLFEKTISDVFFDDMDMVEFVTRAFGYALMGNPTEDIMFIAFGNGSNGKSTIFNAVRKVFGGYARTADASSFVSDGKAGGAGGAREDLVRLRGARFVYVSEPDENGELKEGVVKGMTGGDAITARGLYAKESVEIIPTWTVFMPTNHKPIIKGNDNGIWRRMGMLPFERNFERDETIKKDTNRREKVLQELPGILNIIVKACLRYQKIGLVLPNKVMGARESYRSEMDLLAEWLDEHCEIGESFMTPMKLLWDSWEMFARGRGLITYIRSSTALGRRLDVRFPPKKGNGGVRYRLGLRIKVSEQVF